MQWGYLGGYLVLKRDRTLAYLQIFVEKIGLRVSFSFLYAKEVFN